jgi:hypothetical protein
MLAAALLIAMYPDWVPARWPSSDVKSLELVANTPINCLWLERPQWSSEFAAQAARRGIVTLGVIHREGDPIGAATALAKSGLTGGVVEGNFDNYSLMILTATLAKAKMTFIVSGSRSALRLDAPENDRTPILATSQGLWPGIHVEKGSDASAGPTANPWIDTNTGFLRYARASSQAAIWMAVQPPAASAYPVTRYLQAIGDAAMNGARWVVSLDDDLRRRLLAREPKALRDWAQISAALRHFEDHKEWRATAPAGRIAIVQDEVQARLSGGLFDMLAAKHMPVFAEPRLKTAGLDKAGKLVFEAPPVQAPDANDFVYDQKDTSVNTAWQRVSGEVGRQNMGARLFNVAGMLSHLVALKGQRQLVLHLVNYSDYPASGITARVLGTYTKARLFRPGEAPVDLETEKVEDGTGFAIDQRIVTIATVVLE